MPPITDLNDVIQQGQAALDFDAALVERVTRMAGDLAVNLVVAALILIATFFVARWAGGWTRRALVRLQKRNPDPTLQGFLVQVVRVIVIAVGLIAVLQRLGVQTTSIIAILGAASLAIGLALQGTLSNVAAGVMLLILRPYRVGDVVQVGERAGVVRKLDLFTTVMIDANNMKITVPNSQVLGDVIVNISGQRTRRIELFIGVDYDSDLEQAMEVMKAAAAEHPNVLEDPPVWAGVTGFLDSSVQIDLQAWVKSDNWWQTKADLHLMIKHALDKGGVVIPYPHQVHVTRAQAAPKPRRKADPKPQPVEAEKPRTPAAKATAMGAGQGGA